MPTTEQLRNRLLKKLKELFQLDQPDLDFGFYRIMHARPARSPSSSTTICSALLRKPLDRQIRHIKRR